MEDEEHSPELDNLDAFPIFSSSFTRNSAVAANKETNDSEENLKSSLDSVSSVGDIKSADEVSPATRKRRIRKVKELKDMETTENSEERKPTKRKRKSNEQTEKEKDETTGGEEKKRRRKERNATVSIVCQLTTESGDPGCKQRAILGYRFCIRHILNDKDSPYTQCTHTRRPKSKLEAASRCTNAIRKDSGLTLCSTHQIMIGLKEAKKKVVIPEPSVSFTAEGTLLGPSDTNHTSSPSLPSLPQIQREPLPVLMIPAKTESCLLKALTSPIDNSSPSFYPKPPSEQSHPLLRSVLETKLDPALLPPRYLSAPATPLSRTPDTIESTSKNEEEEASTSGVKEEEKEESLPQYQRSKENIRCLLRRIKPSQRALFLKFMEKRTQRRFLVQQAQLATTQKPSNHRPRTLTPEIVERINNIWEKLDQVSRKRWAASVACRAGIKIAKGELPFTMEELEEANPGLAKQMVTVRKVIPPARIECPRKLDTLPLPRGAPPIRFESSDSSSSDGEDLHPDHIRLRPKLQVRKMIGPYRNIPLVNEMCSKLERDSFDDHQMFPLGFESPDDEEEDDDDVDVKITLSNQPVSMNPVSEHRDKELELYLLRKHLRQERHQLMRTAQTNATTLSAVKKFPLSAGAALRQQLETHPAPPQMISSMIRRCCQTENKQRCERACLPSSNHCSVHVLYNVNQKLFQFCTHPQFCRRPVLSIDAILWDGKCQLHRDSRTEKYGPYPIYADLDVASPQPIESIASSVEVSEEETDTEDDEEEEELEMEMEDDVDAGTP